MCHEHCPSTPQVAIERHINPQSRAARLCLQRLHKSFFSSGRQHNVKATLAHHNGCLSAELRSRNFPQRENLKQGSVIVSHHSSTTYPQTKSPIVRWFARGLMARSPQCLTYYVFHSRVLRINGVTHDKRKSYRTFTLSYRRTSKHRAANNINRRVASIENRQNSWKAMKLPLQKLPVPTRGPI